MRIAQLAAHCGIDSSYLSRIENADTNPSLETLVRIAEMLHISIDELTVPLPWCYEVEQLPHVRVRGPAASHQPLLSRPPAAHFIHPIHWEAPAGCNIGLDDLTEFADVTSSSWIALAGRVIFEMPAGTDVFPELIEKGSVIHFRGAVPKRIQALQDSQLIQVIHASARDCPCRPGAMTNGHG